MNVIRARDGYFNDGDSRFKIVGANNYYAGFATDAMRGAVLNAAKQMGLNVLRVPAFLDGDPWRGAYFQSWNPTTNRPEVNTGENGLQRLDHLIADAELAGIRLILPLVNHWPDFAMSNGSTRHRALIFIVIPLFGKPTNRTRSKSSRGRTRSRDGYTKTSLSF
jgi:endo-1,4-beta-mannosidase